ncbi:MAG TPA: hypothetical protein VMH86_01350 [Rhizomicrobium sp.]|nr:hypothetical protein [Rhizomicrobium sp.]
MNQVARDREGARKRAQGHFAASERRDATVREMIASEQAAVAAKTAKLRALRLAKEEDERLAAAADPAPPKARKTRAKKSGPAAT